MIRLESCARSLTQATAEQKNSLELRVFRQKKNHHRHHHHRHQQQQSSEPKRSVEFQMNVCGERKRKRRRRKGTERERGGGGAVKRNEENNALNRNRFSAVGVVVSLAAARFGQLSFFPCFSFVSIYLIISSKPIRRGFNSRHRQGRTRESQLKFFGGVRVCVCVDCVMFLPRHLGFL